ADAHDRRIGIEPSKYRISDGHAGFLIKVQSKAAPNKSVTPRRMKNGWYPSLSTREPRSSVKISTPRFAAVPAMPVAVPTSSRGKRSDDMVITVTDNVWWAKPPRHKSATAIAGLWTVLTK